MVQLFRRMSCSFALGVLMIAVALPSTLSLPTELGAPSNDTNGRDFLHLKELFGGCNAMGKMCGWTSTNGNDCCGRYVCLLVVEQAGYYCLEDPSLPHQGGWFWDW